MSVLDKIKQDFYPASFSAISGVLFYKFLLQQDLTDTYNFFGVDAPAWALIGSTIFASSLVGNILQYNVLPLIPGNVLAGYEGMIVKPVLSGLSTYGIIYVGESTEASFSSLFLLGAGSTLAGDSLSRFTGY